MPSRLPISLPQVPSSPFNVVFVAGSADLILSRLYHSEYIDGIIGVRMLEMTVGDGSVLVKKVCNVPSAVVGDMSAGKVDEEVASSAGPTSEVTNKNGRWNAGNTIRDTAG